MKKKVWMEIAPGVGLRAVELGESWIPWMRSVILRDFDGKVWITSAHPEQLCERASPPK